LAVFTALCLFAAALPAQEDAPTTGPGARKYSPYPEQTFPNRVYFGETVKSTTGLVVRIPRPLDFVVADPPRVSVLGRPS
jgi:hypothetical protein